MSARSLVVRPRRKVHLATRTATGWLTTCSRDLPLDGTAERPHRWADTLDGIAPETVCSHCLGHLVVARLALVEAHAEILAEQAALRTQLASVLAEVERRDREHLARAGAEQADADAMLARAVTR